MKAKLAQQILSEAGIYSGTIDGEFGPHSKEAAHKYYEFPDTWPMNKVMTGVIQVACVRSGISVGEIDGLWGNKTQQGFETLCEKYNLEVPKVKVTPLAEVKKTYNNWPNQNYDSMVKFYGKVGENQTTLVLPYPMVLAWDTSSIVTKITCHEKVKDSLERILKNVLTHYGLDEIKKLRLDRFGGCLNVRKKRGGNTWSIHSWGAAVDFDPDRNQLKWGKDKAFFSRPEYDAFWKIVEAEGWVSLGRQRDYDWMHIQAATL